MRALAAEVGGEALATNALVAERAELVVLCHKPSQLQEVAREVAPDADAVASILAATPLDALKAAYPDRPVYRFIPSLPVEVRQGAIVQAADPDATAEGQDQDVALDSAVRELFAELGTLVVLDDALLDVAMGLMSCAPGVRRARRRGAGRRRRAPRHPRCAGRGTRRADARRDRRAAAPPRLRHGRRPPRGHLPGGLTARGLDALEHAGLRSAFSDALDAVLAGGTP